ncbi:hypothetical protein ACRALDRAFT_2056535, partial [Sodiomyces alcalophilus JCM 7366]|uniref:uncharacterized protein n=1 Tax=Sodiomyces alcalophilus JCM 7366 TaxID=591952 RepID=UPI0039B52E4D
MDSSNLDTGRAIRARSSRNDALIPSGDDTCRILHDGQETWATFVRAAQSHEPGLWPRALLDPYITLDQVPALPPVLPRARILKGRACWRVPMPDLQRQDEARTVNGNEDAEDWWSPERTHGQETRFSLRSRKPVICDISGNALSSLLDTNHQVSGSLGVLTLCWAYVLSTRLVESQGYQVRYTSNRIHPTTLHSSKGMGTKQKQTTTLHLGHASPALVRWLCSILSPDLGWDCDGEEFPPWSALLSPSRPITITVDGISSHNGSDYKTSAPNSAQAVELLIELCEIFGLGTGAIRSSNLQPLAPCDAAFLAALMIPFHYSMSLNPCFPPPRLQRRKDSTIHADDKQRIRQYLADSSYFMTLSLRPLLLGSTLWSVFWQPEITCNLVSPWLTSIHRTLKPIIQAKDVETLVKIFLARRPRCGIWWYAMFMLGNRSILDWIPRYLSQVEERCGYGSLSPPDPLVSAWSGTKVSFLDFRTTQSYQQATNKVLREDWLRCRYNHRLQDSACSSLAWRPFGTVDKTDIEPELWPWLEMRHGREYLHFTWYIKQDGWMKRIGDPGFRKETGRTIDGVPDDLELRRSATPCPGKCRRGLRETQSKKVMNIFMAFLVENALCERDWENAALPGKLQDYRWFEDWQGLVTMDLPNKESSTKSGEKGRLKVQKWLDSLELV